MQLPIDEQHRGLDVYRLGAIDLLNSPTTVNAIGTETVLQYLEAIDRLALAEVETATPVTTKWWYRTRSVPTHTIHADSTALEAGEIPVVISDDADSAYRLGPSFDVLTPLQRLGATAFLVSQGVPEDEARTASNASFISNRDPHFLADAYGAVLSAQVSVHHPESHEQQTPQQIRDAWFLGAGAVILSAKSTDMPSIVIHELRHYRDMASGQIHGMRFGRPFADYLLELELLAYKTEADILGSLPNSPNAQAQGVVFKIESIRRARLGEETPTLAANNVQSDAERALRIDYLLADLTNYVGGQAALPNIADISDLSAAQALVGRRLNGSEKRRLRASALGSRLGITT